MKAVISSDGNSKIVSNNSRSSVIVHYDSMHITPILVKIDWTASPITQMQVKSEKYSSILLQHVDSASNSFCLAQRSPFEVRVLIRYLLWPLHEENNSQSIITMHWTNNKNLRPETSSLFCTSNFGLMSSTPLKCCNYVL